MKYIFISFFLTFLLACGIISNKAIDYNNSLLEEQQLIANELMNYISLLRDTTQTDKLHSSKKNLLINIKKSIQTIEEIKYFEGGEEFKKSVIQALNTYSHCIKNEYNAIAQYQLLSPYEKSQEKLFKAEAKAFLADEKIEKAELFFIEKQKEFAVSNGFKLTKNYPNK